MAWFVDDSCITIEGGAFKSKLVVDDDAIAKVSNAVGGKYRIPWKKRDVDLVRWRVGNSVETELWVDGQRVPPAEIGSQRVAAEKCEAHAQVTKRACSVCDIHVCRRCCSVDGVRCQACFDAADRAEHVGRRRGWLLGAAFLVLVAVGAYAYGVSTQNSGAGKLVGVFFAGGLYMTYNALRKRRTPEGVPEFDLAFEVSTPSPRLEKLAARKRGPDWAELADG